MGTTNYLDNNGDPVPGTTTIIGRFKESGGLIQWAYGRGKEHGRLIALGREAPSHLYAEVDKACDIGTLAHDMVEAHILGLPEVDTAGVDSETIAKAISAFEEYLDWERQIGVEFVSTEDHLVSQTYKYGGTPDAVGIIDGKLCLLDWKTSNAVYPDHAIQLAAYQHLWNECYPDNQLTGPAYLLRFSKNYPDFEYRKFGDLTDAFELFKHYRAAYDLAKELKKRIK